MAPRELKVGRVEPQSGTTKQVVIFLHGYGADGNDLLGLAQPLGQHMPDTLFLAPDAPEPCRNNPMGYQWFPIPMMDGSSQQEAETSMAQSIEDLNAFLDGVLEAEGVSPDQVALVGFSQGTMMSLHVAPRRAEPFAGVVGFSGRLLEPERLAAEKKSTFPILLAHGDQDPLVPYESMNLAAQALNAAGFPVYTFTMEGTPHGIAPEGLSQAFAFLREFLLKDG
ncbi:alpha/beta hydrolase [Vannielia litorea]|uniref:alpha/beta hydrolase n=1 Tax=Vannielia litorea TaxID=1217970 RepID=UPI001C9686A3|nr:alpha/beta fold hydrolase [Vannielia litorea]MBY6047323.1 dienelactone hydrolase family protein [Vannielia litorea]MBY6074737.1 dienelactone hydrolase family protein [Vannielia litorea]